jgi:hypothetical protein
LTAATVGVPAALPPGPPGRRADPGRPGRLLGRAAAAAITVSVLLIAAVAAAGPSAAVPALRRTWPAPPWWAGLHPSYPVVVTLLYSAIGTGAAGVGCGLAAVRRGARPPIGLMLAGAAVAIGLLTVLPPAGSTDSISYASYGRIAELGHSPYLMTPLQLRQAGDPVGLQATRFWQHDPSLYGPVATAVQWAAAVLGGTSAGRSPGPPRCATCAPAAAPW